MKTKLQALMYAAAIATAACGADEPQGTEAAAPVRVRTMIARTTDTAQTFEAGGTVRPRVVATLSSRIVAPVLAVHASPGARVRAGQVLVRLDGRQLDAVRVGAEATAGSALESAAAAAAERQAAEAALALARTSHSRIATLRERNVATAGELDEAVAALRSAEARARGAEARVKETAQTIEAAREASRAAGITASYSIVTAPFDGIVASRTVDPGNLATPGAPLLTVEDARRLRLEVSVDAARAGTIVPGASVPVTVAGYSDVIDGRVSEVAPSIDAAHSFVVKIDLPPHPALRSGLFGRARFSGPSQRQLTVPDSAVLVRGQLTIVFIDDNGTARMRFVRIGADGGAGVAIVAGISEGEHVIDLPPAGLRDGARLIATESAPPARRVP